MSELGLAIRHVGGYMTDDESQAAFGQILDDLEGRRAAVRRLKAQVDALEAETARLRQRVEVAVEALEQIGKYENVDVLGSHDVYLDYAARIANDALRTVRRMGEEADGE